MLDYTTKIYDYPKYGLPSRHGDYYYYSHNPGKLKMECLEIFRIFCRSHVFITDNFFLGLLSQSIIYRQKTLESEAEIFLDQNELSDDGTSAIRMAAWNEEGTIYAYGQSDKGSD